VPWDLTIWVDTPVEVRRARTLVRDGPDALELWRRNWWPSEEAYIAREQPAERVDLIVSGVRD
jgi:uridine kinase